MFLTITTFTVVTIAKDMAETAGRGSWLPLLITSIIFAIGAALIIRLNCKYEGKMIFDYSSILVGKVGAYILSIFYVIYFSIITIYLVTQLATVLKNDFLFKTPTWATMLIGIPVFTYIAFKGITNVARLFEFIGIFFVIIAVTVHILMISQAEVTHILPLFDSKDMSKYLEATRSTILPFLGIEVLLILPMTKQNGKKAVATVFFTLIGIGLFYILVVESCIMKLGLYEIVHYKDALIIAIRNMEIQAFDFFQRMDFLYLTMGYMGFFMGITIIYTSIIEHLCKLFPKARRSVLTIIVAIISYILCVIFAGKPIYRAFVESIGIYIGLVAAFAIPILLLLISKVRKHAK